MTNTYNGFTNWETWNFKNWHGDDIELQVGEFTETEKNEDAIIEFTKDLIDSLVESLYDEADQLDGFLRDVATDSLSKVDEDDLIRVITQEYI